MGGITDIVILSGTASGLISLHDLAEAVELEKAEKTCLRVVCSHDYVFTDIDGVRYRVQREFNVAPEQIRFEFAPDDPLPPPEPTPVTMYCTASAGLKVRDKPIDGNRVGGLTYRAEVRILPSGTEGWGLIADVTYEGKQGYVSLSWLSTTRP